MSPLLLLFLQVMAGTDCHVQLTPQLTDLHYVALVRVAAFFVREPCSEPAPNIDVFAEPAATHKVAEIRWVNEDGNRYCEPMVFVPPSRCPRGTVPIADAGYKDFALRVLRRRGDWVQVRLDRNSGWIHLAKDDEVISYADLVLNALAAFTDDWDGRLYRSPGVGMRRLAAKRQNVTVTDSREVRGHLWFEVHVLSQSPCEGGTPKDVAVGWVRAYSDSGQPTVMDFSRGC